MRNITLLRKDLSNSPKKLELLNYIYRILEENNFPNRIQICTTEHYSSKLKKTVVHLLGYKLEHKKISNSFWIKK